MVSLLVYGAKGEKTTCGVSLKSWALLAYRRVCLGHGVMTVHVFQRVSLSQGCVVVACFFFELCRMHTSEAFLRRTRETRKALHRALWLPEL